MKKAFIRILCLLLGVNVFTACYGPGPGLPPPDQELIQKELEAMQQEQKAWGEQQLQEDEPEEEAETPEQE